MITVDIRELPVFWINLDHQPERKERMEKFFLDEGFSNVTRVPGVVHERTARGCGLAFIDIFKTAPDKNFIIFEDDCVPTEWYDPIIEIPEDTDAFYLGVSGWARKNGKSGPFLEVELINENTYRIFNMLSGHAIYYRTKEYVDHCKQWCLDYMNESEDNFDIGIAERMNMRRVYCAKKPIVYQTSQAHITNGFVGVKQ